ncbi:hypothetical protein JYU34_018307 [Plutella xylostella]|uniref:Uncharacterized protein n=1 Tax=Plutella xylostella TaxID=51655 RepID=A0ABQ7Q123_PLUXY|nr:hypothetical protein JYU34_018307 [Plutella xylostella]
MGVDVGGRFLFTARQVALWPGLLLQGLPAPGSGGPRKRGVLFDVWLLPCRHTVTVPAGAAAGCWSPRGAAPAAVSLPCSHGDRAGWWRLQWCCLLATTRLQLL